ncbi:MAG: ribonuclease HII [SAR202 cluster bacterium]|nr:ribonuclease HII [SAR202 cluster bacterium]
MPDFSLEHGLRQRGFGLVAGVDEAGRGPLAGPVVAGAVVLDPALTGHESWLAAVDDSKRLSPAQREKALALVQQHALAVGVGSASSEEIDRLGILAATIQAMLQAVAALQTQPQHLLLDYIPLRRCRLPFQLVVKGDSLSYSIAAASIVAKVTRDRWMLEADARYPGYGFARHKGYPTAAHRARLRELGPCPIHRRSYAPVQQLCLDAAALDRNG